MTTVQAADNFTPPQIWRRIFWIQTFTIVWMTAEAGVALASAWRARSPALLGFGGDSLIELLSAPVGFWRFRERRLSEPTWKLTAANAGNWLLVLAVLALIV